MHREECCNEREFSFFRNFPTLCTTDSQKIEQFPKQMPQQTETNRQTEQNGSILECDLKYMQMQKCTVNRKQYNL